MTDGSARLEDQHWMRAAIALARQAEGRTAENPPVGCIILDAGGRLAGSGRTAAGGRTNGQGDGRGGRGTDGRTDGRTDARTDGQRPADGRRRTNFSGRETNCVSTANHF